VNSQRNAAGELVARRLVPPEKKFNLAAREDDGNDDEDLATAPKEGKMSADKKTVLEEKIAPGK